MTSYKKEENIFTRNPGDEGRPGDSEGEKRHKGGNLVDGPGEVLRAFPQDNVHGVELEDCHDGREMEGGVTSLKGQLEGASAVPRQTGRKGKF